jgi:hypothetical protein
MSTFAAYVGIRPRNEDGVISIKKDVLFGNHQSERPGVSRNQGNYLISEYQNLASKKGGVPFGEKPAWGR